MIIELWNNESDLVWVEGDRRCFGLAVCHSVNWGLQKVTRNAQLQEFRPFAGLWNICGFVWLAMWKKETNIHFV